MSSKERLIDLMINSGCSADVETFRELTDYLLGNNVIPMPCKFQQKVYVIPTIANGLSEITEMECIGFILSCDNYCANLVNAKNKLYQPSFGDFGKSVFLTKEEVEAKLKECEVSEK